jgi:hypothetical protein
MELIQLWELFRDGHSRLQDGESVAASRERHLAPLPIMTPPRNRRWWQPSPGARVCASPIIDMFLGSLDLGSQPAYRVRLTELENLFHCQNTARFARWIGTDKR